VEWKFDELASALSTGQPLYSRAVVGDLCPDPVTPLTATVGVGAELGPAWAEVYAGAGLEPWTGATEHAPVAMFGAYLYLDTTLPLLFGDAATGADPLAFARQYLGERPDVPRRRLGRPRDRPGDRPGERAAAARLDSWVEAALRPTPADPGQAEALRALGAARAGRGELGGRSDAELAQRIVEVRGALRVALRAHAHAELSTAVTSELLTRTAEEAGHPGITGALLAGSAGLLDGPPATRLWEVAGLVRRSDTARRLFGHGLAGLADALTEARGGELSALRAAVEALCAEHGHLGAAEWELAAETWGTDPRLVLAVLDVLRRAEQDRDPSIRVPLSAARAVESADQVRHSLRVSPTASVRFEAALTAGRDWLRARGRIRRVVSALHHEQRLAARELGRRHVASGLLDGLDQIFMLLAGELEAFVAEPERLGESLRMRAYDYHALATYQPPFVSVGRPPPVVRWPREAPSGLLAAGRGLTGTPAAAGLAEGTARVPHSAATSAGLHPGDVLVVASAGPAWVPLLPAVSAVVVDAGGPLSEVAAACRDLGIPCVVATVDATRRIGHGASVQVDGGAGSVRMVGRDGGQDGPPPGTGPSPGVSTPVDPTPVGPTPVDPTPVPATGTPAAVAGSAAPVAGTAAPVAGGDAAATDLRTGSSA
jgi:pyruvate,water dikinase